MSKSFSKLLAIAVAMGCTASSFASNRAGMLIGYPDAGNIDNFQEDTACRFFLKQNSDGVVIAPGEISKINAENLDYIWVHIDRLNMGCGNLPKEFSDEATVAALKQFLADGGNLLLTKQATQLVHLIGRIDAKFAPGIYGDGDGGMGTDVWTVNAQIGYWFTKEGDDMTQFYDRRNHPIYKDLRTSDAFEWETYPMEGTGDGTEMWREDHNCMWDLNAYNAVYTSEGANAVEKFEKDNNALVLGTWGHVQDHAVAGIVEFLPQDAKARGDEAKTGRIVANGLAACEWSPRQGVNAFHSNLEALTINCMNYLRKNGSATRLPIVIDSDAEEPVEVYNLQGMRIAAESLTPGLYIVRQGKESSKVLVK